ncbi:MAG: pyrroline-5-carboxylate reductase [Acidimicrobiaceae bacterium]|nr:pyrroline-5-carboxylate reductase [Acidimicrobiaceae bacterium]
MSFELVVIGGGNMGAALVGGLLDGGVVERDALAIVEPSPGRRAELAGLFPDLTVVDEVPPCRSAVLAVKPHTVPAVAAGAVAAGATRLLSVAAGVTTRAISEAAGEGVAVVRAMPNTPALVGQGVSAIAAADGAGDADLDWADSVLGAVGLVVRVDEGQLDAVTGLTGSGPAYVFLIAEALIDAGVLAGLPRDHAEPMVAQLLVGAAALLERDGDPAALRARVTSPGGTTAAGLRVLEERATRAALIDAVQAAAERSRELGA